eukprot:1530148-Ditylum_brightwellii.AAC.1
MVKGLTEHWCGRCASWKKDHDTDVNRDKCPNCDLASKTIKAQVATAAADQHSSRGNYYWGSE